jgi:type I restriction enzyme R subunit
LLSGATGTFTAATQNSWHSKFPFKFPGKFPFAALRKLLDRRAGGVIFATIQKFRPEDGDFEVLTARRNVVVFVDEAHRSQYGFDAKIDSATGEVSYGFAHYVRKGLPNATFVGFTGTPIEMVDKNTKQVFGDYIDVYDITQAVEDNATVPIHYEGKIVRLKLDDDTKAAIDDTFDEVTEGMEDNEKAKFAGKWSTLEALAGASERLDELASLIVQHFEKRQMAINGKGMIVCMSRRVCVDLYERITKLRPAWHDSADDKGKLKVVMTGSAADPPEYQAHVRNKQGMDHLAKRYRDPGDDFQLVIVRDMWLTGFDCPSMHTLYIDKPMHGHNLMQAIARVNRIFKGKPAGLVVDTIGIATDLKEALTFYSDRDRGITGINTDDAVLALKKCLDVLRSMFHGLDYFCFGEFISICLLAAKTLPWLNTRLVAVPEARWSRGKGQTSLLKMTLRPAFWRCRAAWRRSVPA